MTKEISVNGEIHRFPDDATNDDISMALNGHNQSIGQDIKQSFSGFPQYAKNMASALPNEVNEALHTKLGRSLRLLGAGTAETWNAVPESINYAGRKMGYTGDQMNHVLKNVDFDSMFGLGAPQPGDNLWKMITPGGLIGKATKGLKGLKALGARSLGYGGVAASQGENPIQAMLAGSALEGIGRAAKAAGGATVKGAKIPYRGYQKWQEPAKALQKSKDMRHTISEALNSRGQKFIEEEKSTITPHMNKTYEDLKNASHATNERINELFPHLTEDQRLQETKDAFKEGHESLHNESQRLYGEFTNTPEAHGEIKTPFDFNDVKNRTNNLYGVDDLTKKAIQKSSIKIENTKGAGGENYTLTTKPTKSTVNDYVALYRQLRDAAHELKTHSYKENYMEKRMLDASASELKRLQAETLKKIEESAPNAFQKFEKAQQHYADHIGPIMEDPTLRAAVFGKKVTGNPYSTLAQPGYAKLKAALTNNPMFRDAMVNFHTQGAAHPSNVGINKIDPTVQKVMSSEQSYALRLKESLNNESARFDKLRTNISKPDQLLTAELNDLKSFSPEAKAWVERALHEKSITNQMKQEAKKLKFNEKQLSELANKRKEITKIVKTAAGIKSFDTILSIISNLI